VVHSILQEGPTITITFKTGDGLTANKTEVKYRNVVIGQVSDVELSNDQKKRQCDRQAGQAGGKLHPRRLQILGGAPAYRRWRRVGYRHPVVGDYIGADIGQANARAKIFKGTENPPPITYGEPGKRFTLHTQDLGSLDIGSPVYYRKIPVGQVVAYALDPDGKG
jgi:paraquat-inducible protein B